MGTHGLFQGFPHVGGGGLGVVAAMGMCGGGAWGSVMEGAVGVRGGAVRVRGGGARGCVGVHSVRTVQGFGFCLQQAARLSEGRAGTLGAPGRGAAATGVRPSVREEEGGRERLWWGLQRTGGRAHV